MGYIAEFDAMEYKPLGVSEPGHGLATARVYISSDIASRWGEVECHCGHSVRTHWRGPNSTYRDLLSQSWFLGCGFGNCHHLGGRELASA